MAGEGGWEGLLCSSGGLIIPGEATNVDVCNPQRGQLMRLYLPTVRPVKCLRSGNGWERGGGGGGAPRDFK